MLGLHFFFQSITNYYSPKFLLLLKGYDMFCGLSRYSIYDCTENEKNPFLTSDQPARIMGVLYHVQLRTGQ